MILCVYNKLELLKGLEKYSNYESIFVVEQK